jgi:hypothetical protein
LALSAAIRRARRFHDDAHYRRRAGTIIAARKIEPDGEYEMPIMRIRALPEREKPGS